MVLTVELPDCMTHLYTCGGNSELIQGQHVISVVWLLLIDLQQTCYVVSFIVSDNDLIVKFLFQAFHGIDFYTFEMMPLHFYLICRRVSNKHVCLVPVSLWTPKPSFCPFTNSETGPLALTELLHRVLLRRRVWNSYKSVLSETPRMVQSVEFIIQTA